MTMPALDTAPSLDDASFARIQDVVRARSGIVLGANKRHLCQTRLLRRLRTLGLDSFRAYVAQLEDPTSREHDELVNAITTNVTAFFREPHHFEWLGRSLLPALVREHQRTRLRVWSAGCSSGEEPWSLAMVLDEARLPGRWDVKVLATDIDTQILDVAAAGRYAEARLSGLSAARRKQYLVRAADGESAISDRLRELVRFRELNLLASWPMRQPFDLIFCRNVIIYFDADNKHRLVRRFMDALAPGGHLVLGHSESILRDVPGLVPAGKTTYRKVAT